MVLGVDEFRVRTPFEDLLVRAVRGEGRPAGEDLALAVHAARELRLGLSAGDPEMIVTAQLLERALSGDLVALRPITASAGTESFLNALARRLEEELLVGRLVVKRTKVASLTDQRDISLPALPPLPPARRESGAHTFEVRFVDEIGKAISGIDAEFTADGAQTRGTNAAGIALLDGVQSASANVSVRGRPPYSRRACRLMFARDAEIFSPWS